MAEGTSCWQVVEPGDASWVRERACQYGDGVFETVACRDGQPCLWELHQSRLDLGCIRLGLPSPDQAALTDVIRTVCRGHVSLGLKILWTAGHSERGYRRPVKLRPTGVIQVFSWIPPTDLLRISATVCEHRVSENPALAGLKHLNRLDQVIARGEWSDESVDEGIMLGQDGRVVCGTQSNVLIEHDGRLLTPELRSAGVSGVVRQCLVDECARANSPIEEAVIMLDDVLHADAVYLTNALMGIARVSQLGDERYDLERPVPPVIEHAHRLAIGLPVR